MSKFHSTQKSFAYAFSGVKLALKNEPNFRIHVFFAIFAIVLSAVLKISFLEFAIILLTIGFVLILELINTMLEALVDLVSPQAKDKAKIAKDVSAASVLVSAIVSVLVGGLVFLPKLFEFIK